MRIGSLFILLASSFLLAFTAPGLDQVVPNDNRSAGGTMRGDTLVIHLEARLAAWRPNLDVDSSVTAQVFAEVGRAPTIPGPLVRVASGTPVVTSIHNTLDSTLVVYGLRGTPFGSDSIHVRPGETRTVRWIAGAEGTYLYWGTTTRSPVGDRPIRDSQLTGALVVDAAGVRPDTAERIFVITVLDLFPDDTIRNPKKEDVFDRAINGRSWPYSEQLAYPVGATVKWRLVNGSYLPHPMHLHGFHYTVTGKGVGNRFARYPLDARPEVVTELMVPGSTYDMEWTPTRAGRWLFHCHMIGHISPFPDRPDSLQMHDMHDLASHPMRAMMGLILGVTTTGDQSAAAAVPDAGGARPLRLLAQQRPGRGKRAGPHGYVLQRGAEPARDSVEVPGPPLILTRGERTAITVVNRLTRPTTVHWHGMELESVFDGVAGWSRTAGAMAPLVAPGDSFTVAFTPPRAGTFIYHTHMDEGPQLRTGMYGPMIVMEPGIPYDPARDLTFIVGSVADTADPVMGLDGQRSPAPRTLSAGTYRLRLINIHASDVADLRLFNGERRIAWRALAKDGADLPPALMRTDTTRARLGVGETADYEVTFEPGTEVRLEVVGFLGRTINQLLRISPRR